MQIKLHIGHFKTGTTSFQSLLSSQRKRLRNAGVLYPIGRKPFLHQQGMELSPFARDDPDQNIKIFMEQWLKEKPRTLILSAEALSNPRTGGGKAIVESMKQFGEVEVIYMVRHWSSYLPSRFKQNTKAGDKWSWEEFVRGCNATAIDNKDINFAAVICEYLEGDPGSFTLLGYNAETAIEDLLLTCGLDPSLKSLPRDESAFFGENLPESEVFIEANRLLNLTAEPKGPSSLRFDTLRNNTRLPRRLGLKKVAKNYLKNPGNQRLISNLIVDYPSETPMLEFNNMIKTLTERLHTACRNSGLDYPFLDSQHYKTVPASLGSNVRFDNLPQDVAHSIEAALSLR